MSRSTALALSLLVVGLAAFGLLIAPPLVVPDEVEVRVGPETEITIEPGTYIAYEESVVVAATVEAAPAP